MALVGEDVLIRFRAVFAPRGALSAPASIAELESSMARAGQGASILAAQFRRTFTTLVVVGAGTAKVFADVQVAQTNLQRVTGLSGDRFITLTKNVRGLAAGLGLTEVETLDLATTASKLGIEGNDLVAFVQTARQAAVALGMGTEDIADSLAHLRANLGLSIGDLNRLTGAIVALDNSSATTFPAIVDVMQRVGPAAKILGLATTDLAAVAAALTEVGISAPTAGTALQTILANLTRRAPQIAPLLGLSTSQLAHLPALEQLRRLSEAFVEARQDPKQFDLLLSALNLHGSRADVVLTVLGSRIDRLNELLGIAGTEFSQGGLLARYFGAQASTLSFRFLQLKSRILGAAASIGERLAPVLTVLFDGLGRVADVIKNSPMLQYAIAYGVVGGMIGSAALALRYFAASQAIALRESVYGIDEVRAVYVRAKTALVAFALTKRPMGTISVFGASATTFRTSRLLVGSRAGVGLRVVTGLTVAIGAGVIQAFAMNAFGVTDAFKRMIEPFTKMFDNEGQSGIKGLLHLLSSLSKLLGYVVAAALRPAIEILTPVVKMLAKLLGGIAKVTGFVVNKISQSLDYLLPRQSADEASSPAAALPRTGIARTLSAMPSPTPRPAAIDLSFTFDDFQIRSDNDLRTIERLVSQKLLEVRARKA